MRKLTSEDVLERLSDLFVRRGVPGYLRSGNGSEFTAHRVRAWIREVDVTTLHIESGSPWENGYIESFNRKLRDQLLARETFDTLMEAQVLIKRWRNVYSTLRPHSSLSYVPPPRRPSSIYGRSNPPCKCTTCAAKRRNSFAKKFGRMYWLTI